MPLGCRIRDTEHACFTPNNGSCSHFPCISLAFYACHNASHYTSHSLISSCTHHISIDPCIPCILASLMHKFLYHHPFMHHTRIECCISCTLMPFSMHPPPHYTFMPCASHACHSSLNIHVRMSFCIMDISCMHVSSAFHKYYRMFRMHIFIPFSIFIAFS